MIVFKQKIYIAPLVAALGKDLLVQGAVGLGTTAMGNKAAANQAEEQMQEQRRLQRQQLKAQAQQNKQMMDTLKQVAKQNPNVAGAAAGQMMQQQQFAIPASVLGHLKTAKGAVKDLAVVSKQMGAHKTVARGLAMGATAAGASYLVDKAIQADAKRSGIDLGPTEDTRKEHGKKLAKAAGLATAAGLAIAGAKKGYLGNGLKTATDKVINKSNLQKAGKTVKGAFKEQFVNTKAWDNAKGLKNKAKAVNIGGLAMTAGFAALPAIGYLGTKKAIKDQATQSEQGQREYAISASSTKNMLKTATGFLKNSTKKLEPFIKNYKSEGGRTGSGVTKFKQAPVRHVLGKVSNFFGGGGQKGTEKFTNQLMKQGYKSGNKVTQRAAEILGDHKTLAVGGSIAVGSLMMKPWEFGSKAVNSTLGAVDKNAMRYEKSQNKQVEEE